MASVRYEIDTRDYSKKNVKRQKIARANWIAFAMVMFSELVMIPVAIVLALSGSPFAWPMLIGCLLMAKGAAFIAYRHWQKNYGKKAKDADTAWQKLSADEKAKLMALAQG